MQLCLPQSASSMQTGEPGRHMPSVQVYPSLHQAKSSTLPSQSLSLPSQTSGVGCPGTQLGWPLLHAEL